MHKKYIFYVKVTFLTLLFFIVGKKRRLTFIECNNDINSMIDLAKVADLVSLDVSDVKRIKLLQMCCIGKNDPAFI